MKSLNGSEVKPKKMVFHDQDSKIILLNSVPDKKVFYMDLEKGRVIDELVIKIVVKNSSYNIFISMLMVRTHLEMSIQQPNTQSFPMTLAS